MERSNKLVQTIKFEDGSESTCTREIQGNQLSVVRQLICKLPKF